MPLPPPPPGVAQPPPGADPLQGANELVLRADWNFVNLFRVEDGNGEVLAQATRSMEGLVGLMEMIIYDPVGRFLLALRVRDRSGRPLVQVGIPYLVVDDQGRVVGELSDRGLAGHSYVLRRQDEDYLSVASASRSQPYAILQRGTPVAMVTEEKPLLAKPMDTVWTVRFSAPCQHLHALALMARVAVHRGSMGMG